MTLRTKALFKDTSFTRAVPTFSVDSGLVFERDTNLFGAKGGTQTLEPRLFYVYTPYRDQSQFPNFDTADGTFNLTQIFTENRFVGSDRIGDANQVTAAVVSRFLQSDGTERMRLTFGQRFYFADQRVQLNSTHARQPVALGYPAGRNGPRVRDLDRRQPGAVQSQRSPVDELQATPCNISPVPKKVLNFSNRFQRDVLRNAEVSTQWPSDGPAVWRRPHQLLHAGRSMLESLVGLEYKADCWVFRMGGSVS